MEEGPEGQDACEQIRSSWYRGALKETHEGAEQQRTEALSQSLRRSTIEMPLYIL